MQIRAATPADTDALLGLWWELMLCGQQADPRYIPVEGARKGFRDVIRNDWMVDKPFPRVYVAEDADGLCGYVQGGEMPPHPVLERARTAKIGDMYVAPRARRGGVGRRLVETWMHAARGAGMEQIDVTTLPMDARAVAFWTAMGFAPFLLTLTRGCRRPAGTSDE